MGDLVASNRRLICDDLGPAATNPTLSMRFTQGGLAIKFALAVVTALIAIPPSTMTSQALEEHKVIQPQEVKWGPAPAALPAGAQVAVLFGDPSKQGFFAMRLKAPKGYSIAPHSHPNRDFRDNGSGNGRERRSDPGEGFASRHLRRTITRDAALCAFRGRDNSSD
jgi:hypothetical protein